MNESDNTTMHLDNKSEINARSSQLLDEIMQDPAICERLEKWRRTCGRPPLVADWMCGEA
jgi:hypothetical protein